MSEPAAIPPAAIFNRQGLDYYNRGEWEAALHCFEQALALARHSGLRLEEALALNHLGTLHCYRLGRPGQAHQYFGEALIISRKMADLPGESRALLNLAGLLQAEGRYHEAHSLLERVVEIDRETASPDSNAHRIILGAIRKRLKRLDAGTIKPEPEVRL